VTNEQKFPDGFLWGAATASYQVEGAVKEGGRGPSIWDTFSHTPGRTLNGDTGDVACQHYQRAEEDLALIKDLGVGAYRFSVAWPRIQPDGKGPANQAGLDFYRRLVTGLRDQGTLPMATLYHWDLPQALEDEGGWVVRDTVERYGEYVAMVAAALGDEVGMWTTFNEPFCSSWLGYGVGQHAPGRSEPALTIATTHHLLLAHARGRDILRAASKAPVGISLNLSTIIPASDHELDVAAARFIDGGLNRMYLGPLFKGAYPEDVIERLSQMGPGGAGGDGVIEPGDLDEISRPVDFLGVNYYNTNVWADARRLDEAREAGYVVPAPAELGTGAEALPGIVQVRRPGLERTAIDWEVDPAGLTQTLLRVRHEYTTSPVYITENGAAQHDYRGPDGAVHDPGRVKYLHAHLAAVREAIDQGVDVRGYFVWSLMDNFEWSFGYSMRFGIVWVDYPTGERVPKDSYRWYRQVAAANAVPT
jgi:beta-glucosidase